MKWVIDTKHSILFNFGTNKFNVFQSFKKPLIVLDATETAGWSTLWIYLARAHTQLNSFAKAIFTEEATPDPLGQPHRSSVMLRLVSCDETRPGPESARARIKIQAEECGASES